MSIFPPVRQPLPRSEREIFGGYIQSHGLQTRQKADDNQILKAPVPAPDGMPVNSPARRVTMQLGFTIIELLVVVFIAGLIAMVAMPSLSSGEDAKLDLVAAEVANTIRFARSEAMSLGVARGFRQESTAKRLRVFRMDTITTPATLVYDIYHPIDKHLYDRALGQQPFAFTGDIDRNATFRGTCNQAGNIFFDANGTPWCADPANVLVEQFDVTLTLGAKSRVITLHGVTGRVTIQ